MEEKIVKDCKNNMPPKKKPATPKLSTPVDSHKHANKRANIPTEELRDFIAYEEKAPKSGASASMSKDEPCDD